MCPMSSKFRLPSRSRSKSSDPSIEDKNLDSDSSFDSHNLWQFAQIIDALN